MYEKSSIDITETIKRSTVVMDTGLTFRRKKIFIETENKREVDYFSRQMEEKFFYPFQFTCDFS